MIFGKHVRHLHTFTSYNSILKNLSLFSALYHQCGSVIHQREANLINPNYPESYNGGVSCRYFIERPSRRFCQIRIDFLTFTLSQPDGDGICSTDVFTVEGVSTDFPRICGQNQGQHIYVDFLNHLPVTIAVLTSENSTMSRRWQLHAKLLKCLSPRKGL